RRRRLVRGRRSAALGEAPSDARRPHLPPQSNDQGAAERRVGRIHRYERGIDPERACRLPLWKGGRSMNATTERAALLEGLEIYDEMTATVDDRTLEILERRRRT